MIHALKKQTIKRLEIRIISINYMLNANKIINYNVRNMFEEELRRLSREYEELTKGE